MVIEFLNKLYSEVLEEKMNLETKKQEIQIKIDENNKYIKKLKKSEEDTTDVFSPRKQNRNLRNNIIALEKEQKILSNELENFDEQILILNERLNEVEEVLKIAKQEELQKNLMYSQLEQIHMEQNEFDISNDLNRIIHKAELCSKFIDVDSNRCKIELTSLIKMLYEMLEY